METKRRIPSPSMGEYSYLQPTSDKEGLYPLIEEGTYGRVPRREQAGRWPKPDPYTKKEIKPKIYASYEISDECELHSVVLDKYDSRELRSTTPPHQLRSTTPPHQLPGTTPPPQLRNITPPTTVISYKSAGGTMVLIHPNKQQNKQVQRSPPRKTKVMIGSVRRKLTFDGEDDTGELDMLDEMQLVRQLGKSIASLRDEVEEENIMKGEEMKELSVKSCLEHNKENIGLKKVEEDNVGSCAKEAEPNISKDTNKVKEDDDNDKSDNTEENLSNQKIEMVKELHLLFVNSLMEPQVDQETFVSSFSLNIKDDFITTHVVGDDKGKSENNYTIQI